MKTIHLAAAALVLGLCRPAWADPSSTQVQIKILDQFVGDPAMAGHEPAYNGQPYDVYYIIQAPDGVGKMAIMCHEDNPEGGSKKRCPYLTDSKVFEATKTGNQYVITADGVTGTYTEASPTATKQILDFQAHALDDYNME